MGEILHLRSRLRSSFVFGLTSVLFCMLFVLVGVQTELDGSLPAPESEDIVLLSPIEVPEKKPIVQTEAVVGESSSILNYDSALTQTNSEDDSLSETEESDVKETMDENFVIPVTEEEFDMLCFVVEREVRGHSYLHKQIIAQVIVNRVNNPKFPSTVYAVLHRKNQFSTISNYYNPKYMPTQDTVAAVRSVLDGSFEDVSKGAVFFYAPAHAKKSSAKWFENDLQFLFELEGHRFFKNKTK